ncbi:ulp1 protease family, C-terminal catalytic domain-containing protein [Artemisia annua]|uniref:Ulp1 protease family, C-terminal catalytic domain-containing protein n=1 Tax=Artemisia annua TaxID=35608 RepID=A0A2U1QM38_ARTAN|nr:ulp1 protease family, C-terminal catalytic domain-containing protein [Artemisia annua]
MIGSELEVGAFEWPNNSMETETGIVVMRHMETCMGIGLDKLNCGLAGDTRKLKMQLSNLRNRYASKILLSECNIFKERVIQKISCIAVGGIVGMKQPKVPIKGN